MNGPDIRSPLLRALVYGHVWLGAGAFAQVWLTCHLVPLHAERWPAAIAAGLATVSAYGFMRLAGMPDGIASSEHLAWVHRHRQGMRVLVVLCGAVSAALLLPLAREAWWVALLLGPAIALYIVPFGAGEQSGLRHIPFVKVFLIALVWSGVVVVFPFAAHADENSPLLVYLGLERSCFVLAITLPFDVRDMHVDDAAHRTVPQMIGGRATKVLAIVLLMLSLTIVALICMTQGLFGELVGAFAAYICTAVLVLRSDPSRSTIHYNLLLDGTLVLVPAFIALGMSLPIP
ncbi:MAG: hypothetical protein H6595_07925 [Flavobacteriales bacterium]|nr:hypothetical protein [Flavobacteriales bacterium]MCB9167394.1 hypothetical protein [Flavobacteriales bacterium]